MSGRPSIKEPRINLCDSEREQQHTGRDDRRLFRRKEKRSRKRRENKIERVCRFVITNRRDDNAECEEDEVRFVYEVARDEDVSGRERNEGRRQERARCSNIAPQREN